MYSVVYVKVGNGFSSYSFYTHTKSVYEVVAIHDHHYTLSLYFIFSILDENPLYMFTYVWHGKEIVTVHSHTAIPVTIGLTRGLYYVGESAGSLTVCFEVLSGRTASRSISMQIRTVQGDAEGA